MSNQIFENIGYYKTKIDNNLLKQLKDEASTAHLNNEKMISGLTGPGVPKHYYLKNNEVFREYIKKCANEYITNNSLILTNIKKKCKIGLTRPWINIQSKNQFIPNHNHSGLLGYVIWVTIPYNIDKEIDETAKGGHASCFEISYQNTLGYSVQKLFKISKDDEGTLMMFPSSLTHCVYPFYTSDDNRISVSGNLITYE